MKNEFHITVQVKGGGSGADIAQEIARALPSALREHVDVIDGHLKRLADRRKRTRFE
jgi:hypothetical protein